MHIASQALQVVKRLLCAQIASYENVMDPPWHEKLLEFAGNRL